MTATAPAQTTPGYRGLVRILDPNGFLLDAGLGVFEMTDPEVGSWEGHVELSDGSALTSKVIEALVRLPDGRQALAVVGPKTSESRPGLCWVRVVGIDRAPF